MFGLVSRGDKDGSGIVIIANSNAISLWKLRSQVEAGDTYAPSRYYRILDIPGVDNSNPFPDGSFYDWLNNVPRVQANDTTQEYSMNDVQQMVREAVNKILNKQL